MTKKTKDRTDPMVPLQLRDLTLSRLRSEATRRGQGLSELVDALLTSAELDEGTFGVLAHYGDGATALAIDEADDEERAVVEYLRWCLANKESVKRYHRARGHLQVFSPERRAKMAEAARKRWARGDFDMLRGKRRRETSTLQ